MLGLMTLFLMPIQAQAYVPVDRIVAVVNEDVIMQSELESKIRAVRGQMQQQGSPLPPPAILEHQVLDSLVQNRIQLQIAEKSGVTIDDEILNRTLTNIAAENKVPLTQFREILEQDGYNYEQFREDIRDEITLSQLRRREIGARIVVTEKEIDNFLANQKFQETPQNEIKIAHILLAVSATTATEEVAQKRRIAIQIRDDLLTGADFSNTAAAVSDGANAENGGDLGWRKLEDVPSLFVDYIPDMKKGDISALIKSPSGFHIIKIVDIRNDEVNIIQQSRARHILIKQDNLTTDEQAFEKAQKLKMRIENGDDFALLAKGNSDDPVSAIEGGDLGWVTPGTLVPEFQKVMDSMPLRKVSEPFKTDYGWHIVEVLERRDFDNSESVKRANARALIRNRKIEEYIQNWTLRLQDEAYVEYRLDES